MKDFLSFVEQAPHAPHASSLHTWRSQEHFLGRGLQPPATGPTAVGAKGRALGTLGGLGQPSPPWEILLMKIA